MEKIVDNQSTTNENKPTGRFIKTVNITYSDVQKHHIEKKVNTVTSLIRDNGGKVVSIYSYLMTAGVSTVYAVYNLVYESKEEINADIFNVISKKKKSNNKERNNSENDDDE